MRIFHTLAVDDIEKFKHQLLDVSNSVDYFCYLDSNNYPNYPYSTFGSLFAIDALNVCIENSNNLEQLHHFQEKQNDWIFGFLNYDLKNEIESISTSPKIDFIEQPIIHFFVPKFIIKIENNIVEIGITQPNHLEDFHQLIKKIIVYPSSYIPSKNEIKHRISKKEYLLKIEQIKQHIQRGDIYEMNFCQEFYLENKSIQPVEVFNKLNKLSKAPFTSFYKTEHNYLLCASPERFLKKQNNVLVSQPIKGTRKRILHDVKEDNFIKQQLFFDEKERSENVMIVDLVRNDFARIAQKNSVEVEELFGIYSFEQVHQMISTITCKIDTKLSFTDIIRAVFPMGSMTGAPKIAAMQLIEKYEKNNRGLYSGAVGYLTPKGNFDFNVVIRSILYNSKNKYVSMHTGSAITIDSNAEKEYEECLLKAKAMFQVLSE